MIFYVFLFVKFALEFYLKGCKKLNNNFYWMFCRCVNKGKIQSFLLLINLHNGIYEKPIKIRLLKQDKFPLLSFFSWCLYNFTN